MASRHNKVITKDYRINITPIMDAIGLRNLVPPPHNGTVDSLAITAPQNLDGLVQGHFDSFLADGKFPHHAPKSDGHERAWTTQAVSRISPCCAVYTRRDNR